MVTTGSPRGETGPLTSEGSSSSAAASRFERQAEWNAPSLLSPSFLFPLPLLFFFDRGVLLDSIRFVEERSAPLCSLAEGRAVPIPDGNKKRGRERTSGRNRPDILRNRAFFPRPRSLSSLPDFFYLHGGIAFPPIVPARRCSFRILEFRSRSLARYPARLFDARPSFSPPRPPSNPWRDGERTRRTSNDVRGRNWRLARLFRARTFAFHRPDFPRRSTARRSEKSSPLLPLGRDKTHQVDR